MKKKFKALLALIVYASMLYAGLTASNINTVQAAAKAEGTIDLKAKKLTIPKGRIQTIKNKTLTMVQKRRYQVKAKFGTKTVSTKGTYKSSKTSVATVSGTGLVTAKAPGTATISVTYNGTKQTFKVKVVASHTHSWKTTAKATCAAKGKRLCKTCGVVGSTAKKTTHTFAVTKKATCKAAGTKKCSVCGTTASIAKTAHKYVTEEWTGVEGRGKKSYVNTIYCNGCGIDMTDWTGDQVDFHHFDLDGIRTAGRPPARLRASRRENVSARPAGLSAALPRRLRIHSQLRRKRHAKPLARKNAPYAVQQRASPRPLINT